MQKNCRKKSSQQDPAYETQSEMAKFHEILADHGLYPDEIIFSKKIQRFSTNESPTDKAGYYQIFDNKNGLLGGFYGDWRTGLSGTWYSKNLSKFSPKDFKKIRTQIKKGKEEEAYLRKQLHEDAANNAKKIWNNSAPAQSKHLYLQKKRINSYGLHQDNEKLIIPAVNIDNIVQSIQYIYPDGKKLFLDNGKIKSHFFKINGKNDIIVLCEGYSTAASIYESTGYSVFASFSASNLLPVAQEIRFKYPKKRIIIAADNDQWKAINTGLVKGMEAAKKIQADFVVPNFKNITSKPNDFNDLHRLEGLDTVRNQINAAKTVVVENEPPFVCRHDGVYHLSTDAEEHILFEYVCSPVHVTAHTRNHDNENWGLLLEILDPDGKTHQWAMPMSMIAGNGDSYRSHLMHLGMRLGSAKNSKYLLYDYLMSSNAKKRVRCVSRIGWHGDSFILPNYNYGNSKEEVVLQTLPSDNLFCQSGTLEEWKSNIGKYCIANNRLQFVISLAFAAPFLEPMGSGSGGFNFVGDSSVGKSTLGKIAGSICGGGGINGYISSWRATDNALEGIALNHCDCLLCLDDMGQAPPNVVSAASYMLANGQGKARSNKYGTKTKTSEWRLLILSSSEVTLADKIREDGKNAMAGQSVRFIDIPADAGAGMGVFEDIHDAKNPGEFASQLQAASNRYYGTPLHHYLDHVASNKQKSIEFIEHASQLFIKEHLPKNSCGQVHRALSRFALVAAAGELAISLSILPWPKGSAIRATKSCMDNWLVIRGGTESLEIQNGLSQVRHFFQIHGATRFERFGENAHQKIYHRAGYLAEIKKEVFFLVFPEVFRNEICEGFDYTKISQAAIEKGWLKPQPPHHTQKLRNPKGRFYVFDTSVVNGDSGDTGDKPI